MKDVLSNVKACIFDMDGTIIDSMHIWTDIDIEYFKRFNLQISPTYQKEIEGLSVLEVAKYTIEHYPFPNTIEEMIADWNGMAHDYYATKVQYKPGAYEFMKQCKEKGIRLGIATSNSTYLYEAVAGALGFDKLIDVYITGEDVKCGKPAPECYQTVAKKLNIAPEDCLVFEDLVIGINAGKSANMLTCAVYDSYSDYQDDEKKIAADYYIKDFYELCESGD